MRFYLRESWPQDQPDAVKPASPTTWSFQTKWQLALAALYDAARWSVPKYPVLADAGYGDVDEFRSGLHDRGYRYIVSV
jgi:SRSO17 transposase